MALGGLQSIGLRRVPRAASSWASAMEGNGKTRGASVVVGHTVTYHCPSPVFSLVGFSPLKKCLGAMSADCRLWKPLWVVLLGPCKYKHSAAHGSTTGGCRAVSGSPIMAGLEADGSLSVISVGRRVLNAPSLGNYVLHWKAPSRHPHIAVIIHWGWRYVPYASPGRHHGLPCGSAIQEAYVSPPHPN